MERDLYTIPQAAFRLGCSRNEFEEKYVNTGLIKLKLVEGKRLVARSELIYAIDQLKNIIHKNSLRRAQ